MSDTRPGVQLNSMVYNRKDQPTIPRQDSKPGNTHHYRRNEVHTHYIHGANHRYTTSTTETTMSMFFRDVTDTNQSQSHSGHQQLRFTRKYMGDWRT